MPPKVIRSVPLALLLLTTCCHIGVGAAGKIPQHVCYFDEIHKETEATPTPPGSATRAVKPSAPSTERAIPTPPQPSPGGAGSGASTGTTTQQQPTGASSTTGGESGTGTPAHQPEATPQQPTIGGGSPSSPGTTSEGTTSTTTTTQPEGPASPEASTGAKEKENKKTLILTETVPSMESATETVPSMKSATETVPSIKSATETHSKSQSQSGTHSGSRSESLSETRSESQSQSGTHSESRSESLSETMTLSKKGGTTPLISFVSWTAYLAADAIPAVQKSAFKPLRIVFSALDLRDAAKYCDKAGSSRKGAFGENVTCKAEDVLGDAKKNHLYQIVRSAIAMHTMRLKVAPVAGRLKVPDLQSAFCKLFAVPPAHKSSGVPNADMVLYVASFPSSKESMFAAGAPCALHTDKRPIAGALTYTTKHITPTVYSVRVAMHEMAHALGFTFKAMKDDFKMTVGTKDSVRHKRATELQATQVTAKAREHYNCTSASGMELEDEAGVLSVASRSHWERRNALEELMAGIVTSGLYTKLTLAAFSDMGVYDADLSKAETMEWAAGAGCGFLTKRCLGESGTDFSVMFCKETNSSKLHCAPGRRAMGRCSRIETVSDIQEQHKYIDSTKAGEAALLTDRCPIYEEHADTSCIKGEGVAGIGLVDPQSWCLRKKTQDAQSGGICGKVSVAKQNDVSVVFAKGGASTKCGQNSEVTAVASGATAGTTYICPKHADVLSATEFLTAYNGQSDKSDESDKSEVKPEVMQQGKPAQGTEKEREKKKDTAAPHSMASSLLFLTATALLLLCP